MTRDVAKVGARIKLVRAPKVFKHQVDVAVGGDRPARSRARIAYAYSETTLGGETAPARLGRPNIGGAAPPARRRASADSNIRPLLSFLFKGANP
jgi:hypothetical protein